MTFELRLASAVQKSILPLAVQEPPGLRLAARMIPMMEVSGDFYYARPLSDRRYGVAIIDVSGHGMPAALLTSMIKTEIDRQFVDGRSTAEICSALGEELAPALAETGLYFTAFVGIIDRDSRLFHYTGCGHVAQSGARKPADEQLEEILVSVSGYRSNGSRSDDMTLMIVDVE